MSPETYLNANAAYTTEKTKYLTPPDIIFVMHMVITFQLDPRHMATNPENGRVVFRYSDILSIPEWPDGPAVEIIDGDLFLVPSPNIQHQRISSKIEKYLNKYLENAPVGEVFHAPVDVVLSDMDVVIPDIIFVISENSSIIQRMNIQGVPDLIVEILSTNENRDLVIKKDLYQRHLLPEYWIVDPKHEMVVAHRSDPDDPDKFGAALEFSGEDILTTPLLPGIEIAVSSLFKR